MRIRDALSTADIHGCELAQPGIKDVDTLTHPAQRLVSHEIFGVAPKGWAKLPGTS